MKYFCPAKVIFEVFLRLPFIYYLCLKFKYNKMKKVFFSAVVVALVVSLASCGANRKLGCPAAAKNENRVKSVQS